MNVLIVVDMQNDFVTGALSSKRGEEIVPRVKNLLKTFRGKVFFTKDTHAVDYLSTKEGKHLPIPHCVKGTNGHQIVEELLPFAAVVVEKPIFGSFSLVEKLKDLSEREEVSKIFLVGLCTDICVISNAIILKSAFPETEIVVYENLCGGVTKESHKNALDAMAMCQISIQQF